MQTIIDNRYPTRTKYPKSVKPAAVGMLKPGTNNKKLGDYVQVKKWQKSKIYSLTLEERKSCPTSCEQWNICYGNNMPFAHRFDHTHPDFLKHLEDNVAGVCALHPQGVVIRLHVLGDFFSVDYVQFWGRMVVTYPNLRLFGYTHWRKDTVIGDEIDTQNILSGDRMAIRFSDDPSTDFSAFTVKEQFESPQTITCPEQLGKTKSCATCGLCWSSSKRIIFLEH